MKLRTQSRIMNKRCRCLIHVVPCAALMAIVAMAGTCLGIERAHASELLYEYSKSWKRPSRIPDSFLDAQRIAEADVAAFRKQFPSATFSAFRSSVRDRTSTFPSSMLPFYWRAARDTFTGDKPDRFDPSRRMRR